MNKKLLIDADAWYEFYKNRMARLEPYDHYDNGYEDAMDNVDDWIDAQPTIDAVEVVHGRWERGIAYFMCSECRKDAPISSLTGKQYKANYCPNCGAKMDGE